MDVISSELMHQEDEFELLVDLVTMFVFTSSILPTSASPFAETTMQSIKTVLIGVTGSSFRTRAIDHHLTFQGLLDMRHTLEQLAAENRKPGVIYCSTDPAHIASAHMLAIHPSVDHVIPSKTLCFGRDDWFNEKRRLQDELREAFRTTQGAIEYLRRITSVQGDFEEVMVLTGQCWGDSFGYAGTWHRGALYSFDLDTQNIRVVGVHSGGI